MSSSVPIGRSVSVSDSDINYTRRSLLDFIKSNFANVTASDVRTACDDIRDKILEHDDNSQLSKVQNICRKIYIATELVVEISNAYGNTVDSEFRNLVFALLDVEKFRQISVKILSKQKSELMRQKYFADIAQKKLLTELNEVQNEPMTSPRINNDTTNENQFQQEKNLQSEHLQLPEVLPNSVTEQLIVMPSDIENEPRMEQENETNQLQREQFSGTAHIAAPVINPPEADTELTEDKSMGDVANQLKELAIEEERWSLPELDSTLPPVKKKMKYEPFLDEKTRIPNYAARALRRNESVQIQRIKVFEGPPRILEALSARRLMTNPGFPRVFNFEETNLKRSELFKRHLRTEKKPLETSDALDEREIAIKKRRMSLPAIDIEEDQTNPLDVRRTASMRDILADNISYIPIGPPTGLNITPVVQPPTPLLLQPPEVSQLVDNRNVQEDLPVPEVTACIHETQTHVTDNPTRPQILHFSPRVKSPGKKWREFNYVEKKIEELWSSCEDVGAEEDISAKDLLIDEDELTQTNYLTLIRVLDKMMLQKKLYLELKVGDVRVKRFPSHFPTLSVPEERQQNEFFYP